MLAYGARRTYWDTRYHISAGWKFHVDKQPRTKATARQEGKEQCLAMT